MLSILIVMMLVVFSFYFFTANAQRRLIGQLEALADLKIQALERWIGDRTRRVVMIASLPELRRISAVLCSAESGKAEIAEANAQLRALIQLALDNYPELQEILVLTGEGGRVAFSTNPGNEGQYRVFDQAYVEGQKATFVKNVYHSAHTLKPTMTVSTPLRSESGQVYGVLLADLNLQIMELIIHDRTGLGETGETYLVDCYNVFVDNARLGRERYSRGVHSLGIDAAVNGGSGSGAYRNYNAVPVIGVYRWLEDRELALLIEISQREAFRGARMQAVILTVVGLSLGTVLALGVYWLARRITNPILAVQQAALRVSSGDLDAKAPVLTEDEIGKLAESFNRMTVRLKELYGEVKRKEEHFRSLIESATDVILVMDARGVLSYISPSVERVVGYRAEELLGSDPFELVHPEEQQRLRTEYLRLLGANETVLGHASLRVRHKAGGWRVVEASGRNLLGHPAISGFVITARDITTRQQLEEKLLQAQKMEAVGRLAGGVAHDFNNLLTALIGYADLLQQQPQLDAESLDYVGEIKNSADRAAALTQQLLAYSRKQILQLRLIDLNILVANMLNMLKRLIGENIELSSRMASGIKQVKADPNQLERVIMNLTVNARDAMPKGGTILFETDNVVLDAEYCRQFPELIPGEYVMLAVSDTGCGMEAEILTKIFDPFFTTKKGGKGTGLGLAMVYGIIKQSGGHITVCSEPGRGCTFRIYLPAAGADETERQSELPRRRLPQGSETILVVEDEQSARKIIGLILGQAGYQVYSAENAQEAMHCAETAGHLDLLLTDVVLPGMDGKSLAEALLAARPKLKVLYISGYTEDAIVHHGVVSEGIAFLQKPFTPEVLARKVREVLEAD